MHQVIIDVVRLAAVDYGDQDEDVMDVIVGFFAAGEDKPEEDEDKKKKPETEETEGGFWSIFGGAEEGKVTDPFLPGDFAERHASLVHSSKAPFALASPITAHGARLYLLNRCQEKVILLNEEL